MRRRMMPCAALATLRQSSRELSNQRSQGEPAIKRSGLASGQQRRLSEALTESTCTSPAPRKLNRWDCAPMALSLLSNEDSCHRLCVLGLFALVYIDSNLNLQKARLLASSHILRLAPNKHAPTTNALATLLHTYTYLRKRSG